MHKQKGFAALLMVISLSVALMVGMVSVGDSEWRLETDVELLRHRTQSELAAESCRNLALIHLAEDPEYIKPFAVNYGEGVVCSIDSIKRNDSNRVIETTGVYKGVSTSMISRVIVTNEGVKEDYKYFK